jgi:hypothetical protein
LLAAAVLRCCCPAGLSSPHLNQPTQLLTLHILLLRCYAALLPVVLQLLGFGAAALLASLAAAAPAKADIVSVIHSSSSSSSMAVTPFTMQQQF